MPALTDNFYGGSPIAANISSIPKTIAGNLLSQAPDVGNYPLYLQGVMNRNELIIDKDTGKNVADETIIDTRLQYYKDWRARITFSPMTNINYAERQYSILGRAGDRTADKETSLRSKNDKGEYEDANSGFLRVLTGVGGILFPYTPKINVSGNVRYQKQEVVQSNINYYSWTSSEPESYEISGDFTASNPSEALYCLAIINFLRTITKGSGPFYDRSGRLSEDIALDRLNSGMMREVPGCPPPIMYFSAYGSGMIDEVPVSINSYSYSLESDIDYIEVILDPKQYWAPVFGYANRSNNIDLQNKIIARVPTKFNLSLKLLTNINPAKYRYFSLWDYKNGEYLKPKSNVKQYGYNTGWTW